MSDARPGGGAPAEPAPLAVSVGDPAGVGPMVSVQAAVVCADEVAVALFGDADRLESSVHEMAGRGAVRVRRVGSDDLAGLVAGEVGLVSVGSCSDEAVAVRAPTAEGGRAQLRALDEAAAAVRAGRARALVTGPVSKDAIERSGTAFTGQTEHLAAASGLARDAVTMMFLGPRLRVALVTTHLAVRAVPDAVRVERVERAVVHLGEAVLRLARPTGHPPRIVVTGLNPHAGEGGLFGDEERLAVVPGMERAANRPPYSDGRAILAGPLPAETALRQAAAGEWDGVVTMMHDQATIASKLLDWGSAVNVTWGLPFVRTSVDHGVAYDAAAAGQADAEGMVAAIRLARRLGDGAPGAPP